MNRQPHDQVTGHEQRRLPLPGPLEVEPTRQVYALLGPDGEARRDPGAGVFPAMDLAREMLDEALTGIPLGAYDARIVGWLKGWDVPTVATIASLLRRCFVAGAEAGRREVVDEHPTAQQLRAPLGALTRALAGMTDVVLARIDALRQDAEARHGMPAGDPASAILEDGVYGPALDAWRGWQAAQQELRQALADLGLTTPGTPGTAPGGAR